MMQLSSVRLWIGGVFLTTIATSEAFIRPIKHGLSAQPLIKRGGVALNDPQSLKHPFGPSRPPSSLPVLWSSSSSDREKINSQFKQLLADSNDLLRLIHHIKQHRNDLDIGWEQATVLLDRMSDSSTFKKNMMDRQIARGASDPSGMRMDDYLSSAASPGRSFMYLEDYQKEQLEAVVLVYGILKERRLLRAFSCIQDTRAYSSDTFLPKTVGATDIQARADLPMQSLSPGQSQNYWAYGGVLLCLLELAICNYYGVDAGSIIPATILGFFFDRFLLGGRIFDQVARMFLPRYKERIIRHEAGHFLLAYLLGCPVQNCLLRPVFNGAVFGEAGTIFLDKKLFEELDRNRISASSVDRYTTVVMAGIAAEALTFKNAEGGASDEQTILMLLSQMNPPWDFGRVTSQARWAALRAVLILKDYRNAYEALVKALTEGKGLGACVQAIEEALQDVTSLVPPSAMGLSSPSPQSLLESGISQNEYNDLKKVLMPSSSSSTLSEASSSSSSIPVEEAMRGIGAVDDLSNNPDIKPSFDVLEGGKDPIIVMEEKERKAVEEEEKKLKAKMREINLRLKQVTAQLDGNPLDTPAGGGGRGITPTRELDEEDEEAMIDASLAKLDERMKELNSQLGGRIR